MSKNKKKREMRKSRSTAVAAKRRAEKHKVGFDNTAFKLPDDKKLFALKSDKAVRLDVIPYEVGEGNPYADKGEIYYERTYFVHRFIGIDQTSYVCPKKTCGEPCPICDFRSKLMKDPDANEKLIKDLAPKERQLFNVIDTKDKNKGVQIWDISHYLFGKKLDTEIRNSDEDDNYEKFAELEGGFTLKCGVEERSFEDSRSFYEVVSINFKPRSEDYDEDILSEATCLDDILIIKDYDELKEIFLQTVSNDDDNDDDKLKSKKSRASGKSKSIDSAVDEDKDEEDKDEEDKDEEDKDEEDKDEEDKDEEDKDEDEEDEEDEDEEDEDEEKPKLKKSKSKSQSKSKSKKSKKNVDKKNRCPGGGTFGKDTDELPECNDCPIWDECDDA